MAEAARRGARVETVVLEPGARSTTAGVEWLAALVAAVGLVGWAAFGREAPGVAGLLGPVLGLLGLAAAGCWIAYVRFPRAGRLRLEVADGVVTLDAPPVLRPITLLLGAVGSLLAVVGLLAVVTEGFEALPRRSWWLILAGGAFVVVLVRTLLGRTRPPAVILTPQGLRVRGVREEASASWAEVEAPRREANGRSELLPTINGTVRLTALELGSDVHLVADLVAFYRATPIARGEIGEGTLERLRTSGLPRVAGR